MTIAMEAIRKLREATGAGVLDCRTALEGAGDDYALALARLQEKAAGQAARRSDRPALQGLVELYAHGDGRVGVMVEVSTETDFAARSEALRRFAHEVALQVAAAAPRWVAEEEVPAEALQAEADEAAATARLQGKPEAVVARIVEGRLRKFKDQHVLLRQPSIRDEAVTVAQMLAQASAAVGERVAIRRFARFEAGEEEIARGFQ